MSFDDDGLKILGYTANFFGAFESSILYENNREGQAGFAILYISCGHAGFGSCDIFAMANQACFAADQYRGRRSVVWNVFCSGGSFFLASDAGDDASVECVALSADFEFCARSHIVSVPESIGLQHEKSWCVRALVLSVFLCCLDLGGSACVVGQ